MAIPVHKFVLSICSPVFFAMFNCPRNLTPLTCQTEYEGVLEMLRYMYSGEVELNESNVVQAKSVVCRQEIHPALTC